MSSLSSLIFFSAALACASGVNAREPDPVRPPAINPVVSEGPPAVIPYPPLPEALARGVVIIQFRTENLRVMPVFGPKAVDVSPRLGHLHVTVDDLPLTWAHTSGDPIILAGLTPGVHNVKIEIAAPNHSIVSSTTMSVTVPARAATAGQPHASHAGG